MGSISIREYIQWRPDGPPMENTATLVLTSPGRRFVDIRMLLPQEGGEDSNTIEWAFAGTSSTTEIREETRSRHSVWRHFVDSRTRDGAEAVVDEADMWAIVPPAWPSPSESHDDSTRNHNRTLEKGRMVNPDTGLMSDYEEVWRDVEPVAVPSDKGKVRSVVLELHDDAAERRGLVVCLGRHCQGVVRCGDQFALEQWEWQEAEAEGGGWQRRRRVGPGDLYLPCRDAVDENAAAGLEVGGRVERDGVVWTVVEVS